MRIRKNNREQIQQQLFPDLPPGVWPPPHACKLNESPWDIPKGQDPFAFAIPPAMKCPAPEPSHPSHQLPKDVSLNKGGDNSSDSMSAEKAKKPEIIVIDDEEENMVDGTKQGSELFLSKDKSENKNEAKKNTFGLKYFRRGKKRAAEKPVEEKKQEEVPGTVQPRRSGRLVNMAGSASKHNQFYYYSFGPAYRPRSTRISARKGKAKEEIKEDDNVVEVPLAVVDDDFGREERLENDKTVALAVEIVENGDKCGVDDEIKGRDEDNGVDSVDEDEYYWLYGVEKPLKVANKQ